MSSGNLLRRLERLQVVYSAPQKCQTCFGWPTRLCQVDEETGREVSENMPADGCPACGRPIRNTIRIVGVDPTRV